MTSHVSHTPLILIPLECSSPKTLQLSCLTCQSFIHKKNAKKTMPAKSVGTVQSSFLLNVSPPPIYNVGLRLENDNKCMLARKFCNTCLATCSFFFTTLYKGGRGSRVLYKNALNFCFKNLSIYACGFCEPPFWHHFHTFVTPVYNHHKQKNQ